VGEITDPAADLRYWVMTGVIRRTLAHCHLIGVMTQRAAQPKLEGEILTDVQNCRWGSAIMSDIASELGSSGYLMVAFPAGKAEFSDEMAGELRALIGNDCQDRRDDRQDRRRGPRLFR
jgi:hypothetical protein